MFDHEDGPGAIAGFTAMAVIWGMENVIGTIMLPFNKMHDWAKDVVERRNAKGKQT